MKKISVLLTLVIVVVQLFSACSSGGGGGTPPSPLSDAKAITAFALYTSTSATVPVAIAAINEPAKTITATVPIGTDLTTIVPGFITTGKSVSVNGTVQVSGTTQPDLSNPKVYTVTAGDGTTAEYSVIVTWVYASSKTITAFALFSNPVTTAGLKAIATIDEQAKTISATVPYGTDVTDLIALYTTTGALVTVGSITQVSGTTPNDFSSSKAYIVTDADGATVTYTVTVTIAPSSAKEITMYSVLGILGTINEPAKTIIVTVPYATNITNLAAVYTATSSTVNIGGTPQSSGTTTNDFTTPKAYTVTAATSSTATYTVTITKAANTEKAITAFSIKNYPLSIGIINETAKTIIVYVPRFVDPRALIVNFSTTGDYLTINGTPQVSGVTSNDFTGPVTYTVHAADGSTATYAVTVNWGFTNVPKSGAATMMMHPGDDGNLKKGAAWPVPRFILTAAISGPTVSAWHDNLTGLVWPEDAGAPTVGSAIGGIKTWQGALDYIANLNTNTYLGFTDWRLPNVNEFQSLMIAVPGIPQFGWLMTQGFKNVSTGGPTTGQHYWTSTTGAAIPSSQAFAVDIFGGFASPVDKTTSQAVWPVRTGPGFFLMAPAKVQDTGQTVKYAAGDDADLLTGVTTFAYPRFKSMTAGSGKVIADNMTGLIWAGDAGTPSFGSCTGGTALDWFPAMDHVACLNAQHYLGFTDWRLPNIKEMSSLINYGQSNLVSYFTTWGFTNVKSALYWTSSGAGDAELFAVSLVDGRQHLGVVGVPQPGWVWPVRGGQ